MFLFSCLAVPVINLSFSWWFKQLQSAFFQLQIYFCYSYRATSTKKAKEDKGKKGFDKKSQGSDRGRGRGRGRGHDVIQSHSIFEQGPSEKIARPGGKIT